MKLVKLFILSIVILSSLITVIASLFPSKAIVSRAMELNVTSEKINACVQDLNNWTLWMSDWKDRTIEQKPGFLKIGTQEISLISRNDTSISINWKAQGQKPYLVVLEWIRLKDSVYVIHWSFEQNVSWYPWEKFQTLLNEKLLGSKMEIELQNLKDCIESR